MNDIIDKLKLYDEAYESGESLIDDAAYDQLKLKAHKENPGHPYFMQVGSEVRGGKVKLPFPMGSLTQIQKGEWVDWYEKYQLEDKSLVISDKLDGVSCMLQYKNGVFQIAYTRGNGREGQDITRHVKLLANVPQSISTKSHLTLRGELIMAKDKFNNKWADEFRNPRNMTAGIFNRKESDKNALSDMEFIAYQIVDKDSSILLSTSQEEDLKILSKLGFDVVNYTVKKASDVDETYLQSYLKKVKRESPFELDGIVITINDRKDIKNLSNADTLNPEHSVKYKVLDESSKVLATVVDVHYEVSKHGYLKPRVEILPVSLFGTVVTFATGFNGSYIVERGIGPGATIYITKGGSVIPHILEVVTSVEPKLPDESWHWNNTAIDMVIDNVDSNHDVIFKQVESFFNTIKIDLFKEATLRSVIDFYDLKNKSYEDIILTIISLLESEWVKIVGVNGSKIYASLQRRLSALTMETYLGAVKYLGFGFGVRKAKQLISGLSNPNDVWNLSREQIENTDGFNTTAETIVLGLPKAKKLYEHLNITLIEEEKSNELSGLVIVFTGFRDDEFQHQLEKSGAKVTTSVSKKTTHVIADVASSTSSKAVKAREIGIPVVSLDEFKEEYNL